MATSIMNLADPQLELIDPTPNIQTLFIHFDEVFFCAKLASRAVVRWSKRMYSCAGICSYEGRGGLCDIALSEPLLKLRSRKDLVETLLHEMIHAFLFITDRDQDRDGHGPNFKAHMHRINKSAGLNISIYHDFHDEVKLYQTHWWRCNGPCQSLKPHFGIVRRSMNRAPGPSDCWWNDHKRKCGGTFIKIKEPESKPKEKRKTTTTKTQKNVPAKTNADITKFLTNIINNISSVADSCNSVVPPTKDCKKISGTKIKLNGTRTIVVNKKVDFNPTGLKSPPQKDSVFTGTAYTINKNKNLPDSINVNDQVRSIWANKQIPAVKTKIPIKDLGISKIGQIAGVSKPTKHKIETTNHSSPPAKLKKLNIDDYFKANASLVLKDLYGEDFNLTKSLNSTKLAAVSVKKELADCPVCNKKIDCREINRHLDECLNEEVIEKISNNSENVQKVSSSQNNTNKSKGKKDNNNYVELNNNNLYQDDYCSTSNVNKDKSKRKTDSPANLQSLDIDRETPLSNHIRKDCNSTNSNPTPSNIRKSDNFNTRYNNNEMPKIKIEQGEISIKSEPGTSKEGKPMEQICLCCGKNLNKTVEEHLDECIVFVNNQDASTSLNNNSIIVIDDDENDDVFDESLTLNATGTKTPCPCCMKMIEEADMNDHLDDCLEMP